jgi:signal transduction histidine kinase
VRSLQSWLTTSLVVTLVVLFVLIWVGGSYAIGRIVDQQVTTRLEHDMEALAAALRFDADGRAVIKHDLLSPVFRKPFSGHYFRIAAGTEVVRSRSLWDQDLPSAAVTPGQVRERRLPGPREQELLVLDFGLRKQQRDVTVSVAEDQSPAHADIARLQWRFAVLAATLLLIWIAIQRWLVRRGLRTLEQVGDELIEIQHGRRSSVQVDVPREIGPLVEQINRLTRLTAERLQRHRTAVGNLAHALKTPLTVLTRLADDTSLDGGVRAEIRDNTRRISGLIDRELTRARMAGETGSGSPVSWHDEIGDLVGTLEKIHRDKTLQVDVKVAEGTEFTGDRDDLMEVLANLLDNAFKWARSKVLITVSRGDDQVILSVEDDGPGCTEEQIEQLARRGHRIDESTLGHGLGLSIVAEIVSLYKGEVVLGRSSSLGGFQAVVRLPRNMH